MEGVAGGLAAYGASGKWAKGCDRPRAHDRKTKPFRKEVMYTVEPKRSGQLTLCIVNMKQSLICKENIYNICSQNGNLFCLRLFIKRQFSSPHTPSRIPNSLANGPKILLANANNIDFIRTNCYDS